MAEHNERVENEREVEPISKGPAFNTTSDRDKQDNFSIQNQAEKCSGKIKHLNKFKNYENSMYLSLSRP